ncbi:MAG: tetratricopeptide repeat protein [Candidatus Geothermincolia bacterium]
MAEGRVIVVSAGLKLRRVFSASLLVCAVAALAPIPARAGEKDIPILSERLPLSPIACPLTGEEHKPSEVLAGKASLLFFTDLATGVPGDLARFLAELQTEYAPWLSWVGVLVGPGSAEDIRKLHAASPLRFGECMHDESGSWKKAFNLKSLPAAVFVNEEGYVVRRQYGYRVEDAPGITRDVERLISAGKLAGKAAHDFKLREVGTDAERTLADLVDRDYTIFLSLRSDCTSCREELDELKLFRDRNKGQVSLVVVYHDQVEESPVAMGAEGGGEPPDHELWDPGLSYAERYSISGVPFVLVTDKEGRVALARAGFSPKSAREITGELDRLVGSPAARSTDDAAFAEFRRIRQEALAFLDAGKAGLAALFLERAVEINPEFFTLQTLLADAYLRAGRRREAIQAYTRYLLADPLACDREKIERRIKVLAAVGAQ